MYNLHDIVRRSRPILFQASFARRSQHARIHYSGYSSLKSPRRIVLCELTICVKDLLCVRGQASINSRLRCFSSSCSDGIGPFSKGSPHRVDLDGSDESPRSRPDRSRADIGPTQNQHLDSYQELADPCNGHEAVGFGKTRGERKSQLINHADSSFSNSTQRALPKHENLVHELQYSDESDVSPPTTARNIQTQPVAFRRKIDLSHRNVRQREAAGFENGHTFSNHEEPPQFRGNTGLRKIVRDYMYEIDPLLHVRSPTEALTKELDGRLRRVFSTQTMQLLRNKGYDVDDIVLCSWILGTENSRSSIKRYIFIAEQRRALGQIPLPRFMVLQILRLRYIGAESLARLLNEITKTTQKGNDTWDVDFGAVLLVRLLRHARVASVSCYKRIVDLAPYLVPFEAQGSSHDDLQRITHFYNRFLSLLALPVAERPFLSIPAQQDAQLRIARWMMHSKHQIVLNREGYRALARVQLLHKKTIEEQQWSGVKGPSWPPWRKDDIGIDSHIEYPGRQSRASKVIKRLLEAGYGPESVEREAQILAGWDTDNSPTVQVRRVTNRRPLSWIKNWFRSRDDGTPAVDHDVWAARVAATRSVREAWLCFFSYMNTTSDQERRFQVYHEMFHKLVARIQNTDQRAVPSPGDGKEVFQDPPSTRDLVYVPREPPSIEELYAQMLQDGIRPSGRLLASLVDNSRTIRHGFELIKDSSLADVKKDVLLHPEKYPGYFIRNMFSTIPDYLLASYIGLLTRGSLSDGMQLYSPGSKSVEEREVSPRASMKPLLHGMMLLQIWEPTYLPAYHAVLEGTCVQAKTRHLMNGTVASRTHSYSELWKIAKHALLLLRKQGLQADLICYRKIVLLLRNSMIRAPAQFISDQRYFDDAVAIVKSTFVDAVHGRMDGDQFSLPSRTLEVGQQPYWKDVEVFILLLGFGREFSSIIQLLNWLRAKREHLECVDDNGYKTSRLMCAARVALEATWSQQRVKGATHDEMRQARKLIEGWNWPEDVDVDEFMGHHQVWFGGMRGTLGSDSG